jgi:DNA-binding HxlR family transcriptional regulator
VVGISEKMLIAQLKFLREKGLVYKVSFPEIPPKVEYTLTEKGKEMLSTIQEIIGYGLRHKL